MAEPLFPAPWRVEAGPVGFRVVDATGRRLCEVHGYERSLVPDASVLDIAEARKLAEGIARLPELVRLAMGAREQTLSRRER